MTYLTNANKENNLKLIICLFSSCLVVIFVVITMLNMVMKSQVTNNMFYVQLINYSLPVVKELAYDEADMAESQMSIKTAILEYFTMDLLNPMDILSKENSLFSLSNEGSIVEFDGQVTFNPFKLKDISIFRKEPEPEVVINDPPASDIYNPSLKKPLNETVPEVLIYHTHTTEYFLPATSSTPFDEKYSVVAVGNEIANELRNNYGISVIHDKTIHNTLYNNSYTRAGETLDQYLSKHNSFKVIIDLHRDAGSPQIATLQSGQKTAKLMFVLSKSSAYYTQNLAIADNLKGIIEGLFPGVTKNHVQYNRGKGNFNQDKNPNVVLLEVGTQNNNIDEALVSAKIVARAIAEYINGSN